MSLTIKIPESFLKSISIFSTLLIIFGNIYVFAYYNSFGINIYDYLTLSEIPAIFLPFILRVSILLLFTTSTAVLLFNFWKYRYQQRLNRIKTNFGKLRYKHKNRGFVFLLIGSLSLISGIILDTVNPLISHEHLEFKYLLIFTKELLGIISAFSLLTFFIYNSERKKFLTIDYRYFTFICVFAFLVKTTSILANMDSYWFKFSRQSYQRTYQFKETNTSIATLNTNDTLKYIGRTNSDVFFYQRKVQSEQVIIFKKDKLVSPEVSSFRTMLYPLPPNK